jgi:prepilin-type N-terminal cleavage/methylation domain-containing protein
MSNPRAFKAAFSLIELSIVILIIGILIAGVTQGSRLINAYKLSTARALSNSSPVPSIKDLFFWLDATAETAFLNQNSSPDIEDTDTVSSWKNSNPLTTSQQFCIQGTTGNQPTYVTDGINNLPSVRFNVSNGTMRLSCTLGVSINTENTIFTVVKWVSSYALANTNFLVIDSGSAEQTLNSVTTAGLFQFSNWNGSSNVDVLSHTLTSGGNVVITRYSNPTLNSSALYFNGSNVSTSTSTLTGTFPNITITVGNFTNASRTLGGDIAEVIIYDRALKNEERIAVEKYLGQKWGIKIN